MTFLEGEISQKTGFNYWYYVLISLHPWHKKNVKIIFLLQKSNKITIFTLMNSFSFRVCFNNFVGFITPVVVKWHIHMKCLVAAPDLLVFPRILWLTARLLGSWRWGNHMVAGYRHIIFTQKYTCICAYICKTSQWL